MDLGEFYKKHKQYYYWKLSRNISGTGLAFHAEDVIHDVVVSMIADENCLAKFEHLTEPEAKAYFMACLTHRMIDIIRREKRHREYLETVECYEKKLKTESTAAAEYRRTGTFAAGFCPETALSGDCKAELSAGKRHSHEGDETSKKDLKNLSETWNLVRKTGEKCFLGMRISAEKEKWQQVWAEKIS